MDICLQGDTGLIMCTDSVSEVYESEVTGGGGEKGRWAELMQDPDVCAMKETAEAKSEAGGSAAAGREAGRELIDIWARSALGGTSVSL